MMKKQTIMVLVLVWMLAACAPILQAAPSMPAVTPSAISTVIPPTLPLPTFTPPPTLALTPTPDPASEAVRLPSPDGIWTAILDRGAGSLEAENGQGRRQTVFPPGSTAIDAKWSPDGKHLALVLSNLPENRGASEPKSPPEIRLVDFADGTFHLTDFTYTPEDSGKSLEAPGQIILGSWSPDNQQLLFWAGMLSASIVADGLPLWSLNVAQQQATRLSEAALVNPAYQSWAPDGSALVFTDGGYRSAQVNKWLSLYEGSTGQVRSLLARSEFIPGAVAWSPSGATIAFAAVRANQTGDEWADWMGWDNPAILARRIYLLDPQAGEYRRLNAAEAYQDAPRWSADGAKFYYVQIDGDQAVIMAADPETGEVQPLPGCQAPLPSRAGYYGQVNWGELYAACPTLSHRSAPTTASSLMEVFPLYLGTSWTYTYIGYSQSPSDPNLILHETLEIRETVSDVESHPSFILVHIAGSRSLVEADPGWQEIETIGLGNYEYFYVLREGNVYRSAVYPDPANIQTDQLLQEFQFPMAPGAGWCPGKLDKGHLTPPAETPVPCAYAGKRVVEKEGTYQAPAGSFEHCYQMRDMVNSGGVIQWFCDGVGVVAKKYDHAGSRFGFTQELTAFTLGTPR